MSPAQILSGSAVKRPGIVSGRSVFCEDGEMQGGDWDQHLHQRLLAGDEHALHELYDAYSAMVFRVAMRVTMDRSASEDVTQEAFVQVWEKPAAFSPERGSLRSWVGMIAHRRAVDHVRREESLRRRANAEATQPTSLDLVDIEDDQLPMHEPAAVRAALQNLPEDQRAVIHLAYFEGRTFRQVAMDLGIPEGTAKSRVRLALGRIGRTLTTEGQR